MALRTIDGGSAMAFRLEEALANHNHASIFATVNIGTPPQPLRLLLDTSAGASWLFGENCSACARRRCLSTRRSSSARETNRSFSLRLRSGAGLDGYMRVYYCGVKSGIMGIVYTDDKCTVYSKTFSTVTEFGETCMTQSSGSFKVTGYKLAGNPIALGWLEGWGVFICQTMLFGLCAGY